MVLETVIDGVAETELDPDGDGSICSIVSSGDSDGSP